MLSIDIRELATEDKNAFEKYVIACQKDNTKFGIFARQRYDGFDINSFEKHCLNLKKQANKDKQDTNSRQISYFSFIDDEIVGSIRCRLDIEKEDLLQYGGHIGYDVPTYARGKHISEQLCLFAFEQYKKIGINNVLAVVDEDNYASRHVIEKFNGKIENWIYEPEDNAKVARYWVNL